MRLPLIIACGLLVGTSAHAGFRVSSFKKAGKSTEFAAGSAIDGDAKTAWQVDPESEQVGEWIEIDIPKSEVDKIAVQVGWEKSDETWKDYSRVKAMRVEVFNEGDEGYERVSETTINLEDKKGLQVVDIADVAVGSELSAGKVRLTVTEFTKGEDYPGMAIGEVRVMLKEMDAPASFVGDEPAAAAGKDAMKLMDGKSTSYFVSAEGEMPAFTLEASGWGVSSLVLTNGPKPYARPKKIQVKCAGQTLTFDVADTSKAQSFMLPSVIGYTGSSWGEVEFSVLETYAGTKDGVAIGEIALKATNFDGL